MGSYHPRHLIPFAVASNNSCPFSCTLLLKACLMICWLQVLRSCMHSFFNHFYRCNVLGSNEDGRAIWFCEIVTKLGKLMPRQESSEVRRDSIMVNITCLIFRGNRFRNHEVSH